MPIPVPQWERVPQVRYARVVATEGTERKRGGARWRKSSASTARVAANLMTCFSDAANLVSMLSISCGAREKIFVMTDSTNASDNLKSLIRARDRCLMNAFGHQCVLAPISCRCKATSLRTCGPLASPLSLPNERSLEIIRSQAKLGQRTGFF